MIELNEDALRAAEQSVGYSNATTRQIITAYLEALPKFAPKMRSIPFDASRVKPGDEVIHNGESLIYHGLTKLGTVIVERNNCDVGTYAQSSVDILVPTETVKVALFKHVYGDIDVFMSGDVTSSKWKQISEWTDIEVTR